MSFTCISVNLVIFKPFSATLHPFCTVIFRFLHFYFFYQLMQTITSTTVSQNVVISMAGISKVYVGEIVEQGLQILLCYVTMGLVLSQRASNSQAGCSFKLCLCSTLPMIGKFEFTITTITPCYNNLPFMWHFRTITNLFNLLLREGNSMKSGCDIAFYGEMRGEMPFI